MHNQTIYTDSIMSDRAYVLQTSQWVTDADGDQVIGGIFSEPYYTVGNGYYDGCTYGRVISS